MEKPSITEKVSGSLAVQAALTGLGATAAAAYAPVGVVLLPVLANALANGRYQKRIEAEIKRINQELLQHQDKIKNLTDAQFKFVNEAVLTLTQTLEDQKIQYLNAAIRNGIHDQTIRHDQASVLSRIIRDISADEIRFLGSHIQFNAITFLTTETPEDLAKYKEDNWVTLEANDQNRFIVTGLISLGLLLRSDTLGVSYNFTPTAAKLLAILKTH